MSDLDIHKDAFIRQLIRELQSIDPDMSFRDAWDTVLDQKRGYLIYAIASRRSRLIRYRLRIRSAKSSCPSPVGKHRHRPRKRSIANPGAVDVRVMACSRPLISPADK
jgi:hypothetical protein